MAGFKNKTPGVQALLNDVRSASTRSVGTLMPFKKEHPYEYFIRRASPKDFEVAKFSTLGGDQPVALYHVKWDASQVGGGGRCDCPAASYRGTGPHDKHVVMVKEWVANTEGTRATLTGRIVRDQPEKGE